MVETTVDPAALAAALASSAPPVLLDVRWRIGGPPGNERFREGHLPGAHFVDLDRDLAAPPGAGGRHPLPDTGAFEAAMRRAGVSDDRPVVAYDENDSTAAARAWWLLRYFGHRQVQVLDGGYRAWLAADQPIETGPAPAAALARSPPGRVTCRCSMRRGRRGWPVRACCWMPGPRSATGVRRNQSIRWPGTSRPR